MTKMKKWFQSMGLYGKDCTLGCGSSRRLIVHQMSANYYADYVVVYRYAKRSVHNQLTAVEVTID